MTTGNIILGVRLNLNEFKRIDIENYNLEESIDRFKDEVTNKIGVDKNTIALIYCGVMLDGDKSLSSCGIKSGEMIHVLRKPQPPPVLVTKKISQSELEQLVVAFKAFMQSPGYRSALQRLSRPEVLETIKAATPGLSEDPVAIAIIQDPELIVQLANITTVRAIAEQHPTVLDAANYIAAHMHEEAASANSSRAGTSTGYSYSLEALSDEDDMESNDPPREAGASQGGPLTRNTSYSAITAAQLADAILNSTQNINFGNLSLPSNTNSSNPANSSRTVITSEMFNTAIQNALNPTSQPTVAPPGGPPPTPQPSSESLLVRLQPQLQQMQEMGLTNDAVNLRALQITSGDVQAAVELVFNGAVD